MTLKAHARDLVNCTWCPKLCRFCCPAAEVERRETVTPWFKMTLAEMVRAGKLDPGGETGEIFLHCFGCLHCRIHCKHENDVPSAMRAARALTLQAGGEMPAVAAVLDRFRDTGNPWGEDLREPLTRAVDEQYFVPEAQAVVFAGCQAIRASSTHLTPLFELFEALGVDHVGVYDRDELCCGAPLWQAGDLEGFVEHASKLASRLAGVRKVICPCPACAYVLGGVFAAHGVRLPARVVGLDEFLKPLVESRPPVRKLAGRYVYHDPCYLTRFLERPDGARRLLSAVLEEPPAEAHWSGDDALCCGGGGLVPHVLPDVARGAAGLRMEQLRLVGAERVVTACPGCVSQLGSAPDALPVLDFVQLLREAYS